MCQDEWAEAIGIQDEWARRMGVSTNGTAVGGRSASAILEEQLREKEDVSRSPPPNLQLTHPPPLDTGHLGVA